MKLLPRHKSSVECNCYDKFPQTQPTQQCKWTAVERDSACGWAIRIYDKLKADLEAEEIKIWYEKYRGLVDCRRCKVERGCCKKRKLTLAMTSQILVWLSRHREAFNKINKQILDYCRDLEKSANIDMASSSEDRTENVSNISVSMKKDNFTISSDVEAARQGSKRPATSQQASEQLQSKRRKRKQETPRKLRPRR